MAGGKRKKSSLDDIHETPDVSYISNPGVAHEHTDVSVGAILKFIAGLFVFAGVTCLLMLLLFRVLESQRAAAELEVSPLVNPDERRLPPEPRLQVAPGWQAELPDGRRVGLERVPVPQAEMRLLQEAWDEQLNSYGWADEAAGTARIPIDEAIRLYAQRQQSKAPQQQGQQQQTQQPGQGPPETAPSMPSSGHATEQRHQ